MFSFPQPPGIIFILFRTIGTLGTYPLLSKHCLTGSTDNLGVSHGNASQANHAPSLHRGRRRAPFFHPLPVLQHRGDGIPRTYPYYPLPRTLLPIIVVVVVVVVVDDESPLLGDDDDAAAASVHAIPPIVRLRARRPREARSVQGGTPGSRESDDRGGDVR